ncbi:MAG: hypothetical protein JXJ20_09935 [Anaerolineae bacterium]|nr:hypothetical protein [Anaerolineae bacterium]
MTLRGMAALTGVLFLACTGLVVGGRAIGRSISPSPALLEPGDCEQPCWQGIQPGVSTREEFAQQVREVDLYSGRATDYGDSIAVMFELSTRGWLTLADVIREFGTPERVDCLAWGHSTAAQSPATSVRLYFAGGLIEVSAMRADDALRLSPDMRVRSIRYYAPGEPTYPVGKTSKWRGFGSVRVYPACHMLY